MPYRDGMRTILADSEPAVRRALCALLTDDLHVEVVGEADSLESLRRRVKQHQPDLVVVAWNLVAARAAVTLTGLRRSCPGLRVVVLGLRPETREPALAAGADGFACKVDAPGRVLCALRDGAVAHRSASRQSHATGGEDHGTL